MTHDMLPYVLCCPARHQVVQVHTVGGTDGLNHRKQSGATA